MARGVVDSFFDWARDRPGIEPDVIETLVDLKANYLDDRQPTRWRSGDLSELLLELVPRKVSADEEWYAAVVPTARAFLTRLHSRGELHRASAPLPSLLAELDDAEAEFVNAVHDPSRFGMAKAIFGAAGLEGLPERAELDEAMARFNALPFAERDAVLARFLPQGDEDEDDEDDEDQEQDDLPDSLPGTRLPPVPDLATAARESRTMRELQQLDGWLGAGRAVTATGVLTLKEARSLQETLGWRQPEPQHGGLFAQDAPQADDDPETGDVPEADDDPEADDVPEADGDAEDVPARKPRSARDIPRVHDLWELALDIGALDVQRTRAHAGRVRPVLRMMREAPAQAPDEAVLALWQAAFEAVLYGEPDTRWFGLDPDPVSAAVRHALVAAYEDDDHTVHQVAEETLDGSLWEMPAVVPPLARAVVTTHLLRAVERLAELGATDHVAGGDDLVSLTPLGRHGLRTLVLAQGGIAPLVEEVAGLPADRALRQILIAGPDLARDLVLEWLAGRELRQALRELLLVVREMRAALRYQALTVLVTIDDIPDLLAELSDGDTLLGPVVRSVLADTEAITRLRIEAAEDLEELGDEAVAEVVAATQGLAWRGLDMVPPERDVLVVDSLARAVLDLEEPVRSEDVDSEYWSLLDEPTVNRMTGSEHPETDAVLRAIATGHPAGRIRKAAKKALHKRTTARQ